jgi:hypothetical protein
MSQSYDPETIRRIRASRQVFAGNEVEPIDDPWARPTGVLGLTRLQRNYVLLLVALLLVGVMLIPIAGIGVASVPLFFLGVGLLAGWLLF